MQSNVDDAGIGTGFNELPTRTQTRQIFCAEYDEIALRAKSIWAHDNQMPLAADDISINYLSMFFLPKMIKNEILWPSDTVCNAYSIAHIITPGIYH